MISVTKTPVESAWAVNGQINLTNPRLDVTTPMVLELKDVLGDTTQATITGCTGSTGVTWDPSTLRVSIPRVSTTVKGTATCIYTAAPATHNAVDNTAYAKVIVTNSNPARLTVSANALIDWSKTEYNPTATLTDTLLGLNESLSGAGPWSYNPDDGYASCGKESCRHVIPGRTRNSANG